MAHELGHVVNANQRLSEMAAKNTKLSNPFLDNEGHVAIQKMTYRFLQKNNWLSKNISGQVGLSTLQRTPDSYNILSNSINTLIRKVKPR